MLKSVDKANTEIKIVWPSATTAEKKQQQQPDKLTQFVTNVSKDEMRKKQPV